VLNILTYHFKQSSKQTKPSENLSKTKTGIKQDKFVCCFQNQWFWTGGRNTRVGTL